MNPSTPNIWPFCGSVSFLGRSSPVSASFWIALMVHPSSSARSCSARGCRDVCCRVDRLSRETALGGGPAEHIILHDNTAAGDGLRTAAKRASLAATLGKIEPLVEGCKDSPHLLVNVKVRLNPPLDT